MSAAAVAAGAMAVESQNIVGVDTDLTSVQGFNFLAAPFVQVGYNTADISNIKISDGGAGNIGWGDETFALWAGPPRAIVGSGYTYYSYGNGVYQWENDDGDSEFSIEPGQGVVIDCAAGLTFKFAGQVSDTDAELTSVKGFNFYGNPFAEDIDIQAIQLDDGGNDSIGWGDETFALWAGPPRAVVGSGYTYYSYGNGVYQWENDDGDSEFTINPGQGFVIDCAAGLTVSIESPYSL